MITVFTQNCNLVNISNFSSIMYVHDDKTDDNEYMIVADEKYILGRYDAIEIPNIIAWMGSSIAGHKTDENLCITMPMSKRGDEYAENGGENSSQEAVGEVPTKE